MREPKIFKAETFIDRPLPQVFDFFSKAENLEKITPPWVKFKFLTPLPPSGFIEMKQGTIIDYQIKLHGVPVRWRTLIEVWEPQKKFVDIQLKGPFKLWHHTHEFKEAVREGKVGTIMNETVRYLAPFGILGDIVTPIFVKPDVEKIFAYRTSVISKFLGSSTSIY